MTRKIRRGIKIPEFKELTEEEIKEIVQKLEDVQPGLDQKLKRLGEARKLNMHGLNGEFTI